ncbi:uncharacterized protein LOC133800287 [Humulus lupulus]|uniref:uncharacterized protein LOC133800287 n=1 Tax=Humulus lupulus TaxID=3486 RepID=UPI002B4073B2|nr:uncharacterized protein LOC133800287 [Humulus lupulus]
MGFIILRDFNLTLLGKQGWRLLTNEDGLVGKVFKACYYPRRSFLNARLGNNPSFIWCSIWETQDIVKRWARWSVGTGLEVNLLNEPWLPSHENPYVVIHNQGLVNQKVASLLIPGIHEWNIDLVNDLFEERDKKLILGIPLSVSASRD